MRYESFFPAPSVFISTDPATFSVKLIGNVRVVRGRIPSVRSNRFERYGTPVSGMLQNRNDLRSAGIRDAFKRRPYVSYGKRELFSPTVEE